MAIILGRINHARLHSLPLKSGFFKEARPELPQQVMLLKKHEPEKLLRAYTTKWRDLPVVKASWPDSLLPDL